MSPFKRLLRRVPPLRWCALQYALRTRQKQSDAHWAEVQFVLTTIGNVTIGWAGIELMLSHLVIWHHVKNRVMPKNGLPRMLAYQLDYIKRQIETDPGLDAATAANLTRLRLRVAELNEFRISVIHGVLHKRNNFTREWHTQSVKIDGVSWRVLKRRYTERQIAEKSKEISLLGHELSPFVAKIIGMPHPANSA